MPILTHETNRPVKSPAYGRCLESLALNYVIRAYKEATYIIPKHLLKSADSRSTSSVYLIFAVLIAEAHISHIFFIRNCVVGDIIVNKSCLTLHI
jgi:hypothetical protein